MVFPFYSPLRTKFRYQLTAKKQIPIITNNAPIILRRQIFSFNKKYATPSIAMYSMLVAGAARLRSAEESTTNQTAQPIAMTKKANHIRGIRKISDINRKYPEAPLNSWLSRLFVPHLNSNCSNAEQIPLNAISKNILRLIAEPLFYPRN